MDGPRCRGYGARSGYDVRTRCIRGCTERRQGVTPGRIRDESGELPITPFIPTAAAPRSSLGQRWPGGEGATGHSEYDPVAKERRPWNAGRKLGAKRALKA